MPGAYLQTSTANPYGHRPWATRLYTTFDDFAYLKQPQNTILRENQDMRPEIYRPPDMRGLGAVVVSGSGRVMGRTRRRGMRGLGAAIPLPPVSIVRPMPPVIVRGPFIDGSIGPPQPIAPPVVSAPPMPGPMPVYGCPAVLSIMPNCAPGYIPATGPCGPTGGCIISPVSPPTIYPPTMVPPVPVPVASGPGGTVYALPGDATTPGSPFAPVPPGQLAAPGTPTTLPDGTVAAATTPPFDFSTWFNSQTWIAGIPNGFVAIGAAGVLWLVTRKRGR